MTDRRSDLDNENSAATGIIASCLVLAGALLFALVSKPELALLIVLLGAVCFGFVWYVSGFLRSNVSGITGLTKKSSDRTSTYGRFSEALQYPVFIVGGGGTIRYVNKTGREVFQNAAVGELITVRFRQPDLRRAIEAALNEKRIVSLEYNEPVPDNRWFAVEIAPIPVALSGESKGRGLFAVVFHELTETKRIDQMRSDFVANASHELRTPLASLVGYLETLSGPAKNDDRAREKFVAVMLDQAERMSRLVNDLLSLSRIEMKTHLKPSETVNLTEILSSVIDSLGQLANQMGVTINFEPQQKVHVHGDRDDLLQVFENIIENGCKYGQDGGQVDVAMLMSVQNGKEIVTVSVRDYGPGIAKEHQHRITERFYRVDVARSREKQGTGLGLAIVKHILQRHDTRLQVMSKPGEGAEFRIPLVVDSVENQ